VLGGVYLDVRIVFCTLSYVSLLVGVGAHVVAGPPVLPRTDPGVVLLHFIYVCYCILPVGYHCLAAGECTAIFWIFLWIREWVV
jgi:hypothetical protein